MSKMVTSQKLSRAIFDCYDFFVSGKLSMDSLVKELELMGLKIERDENWDDVIPPRKVDDVQF